MYKRNKKALCELLDELQYLVTIGGEDIIILNETSFFIFENIDNKSYKDIKNIYFEKYICEINDCQELEKDLKQTIKDFIKYGLIEEEN